MRIAAALICLLLASCAAPAAIDVTTGCPPLTVWTPAQQSALAAALAAIPESSPVWAMEKEWQATRDALRACQKG